MVKLGYKISRQEYADTMMGGINDFLETITEKQNTILETGRESEKLHEALKIYEKIYKDENNEAQTQADVLKKDLGNWIMKNESYVNPRTAQLIR